MVYTGNNMKTDLAVELSHWALTVSSEKVTDVLAEKLGDFAAKARENQENVEVFTFTYDSDGKSIAGYLVAPKNRPGKMPVIIYNRGGTADFGLIPKGRLFTRFAELAMQGYIVVGSQYPGNILSEGEEERGGKSDVDSILRLHDLIVQLNCADEKRIGMCGESRGGMMTYLCMKQVTWIKAALTVGGVANLYRSLEYRPEMLEIFEKYYGNLASEKDARSAVKWADKFHKGTPLCLVHGAEDKRVNVRDAFELAEKLDIAKHPYSLHILMGGDHGLMNIYNERNAIIYDWFGRHLKGE